MKLTASAFSSLAAPSTPGDVRICRNIVMGRVGIEPANSGLKVHPNKLQRGASEGKALQIGRIVVATNCGKTRRAEASLYAQRSSC
jgi:hypothetical protein